MNFTVICFMDEIHVAVYSPAFFCIIDLQFGMNQRRRWRLVADYLLCSGQVVLSGLTQE